MKKSELKQLIREVISESGTDLNSIIGKTIKSVESSETSVSIEFADGKSIAIFVDGHDDAIGYNIQP